MVWPTIVGRMTDGRDEVFTTFLLVARVEGLDLLLQRVLDDGTLLDGPTHLLPLSFCVLDHEAIVRGFLRVLRPIAGLPHGVWAMPPTGDFASPPPAGDPAATCTTAAVLRPAAHVPLVPGAAIFSFSCSMFPKLADSRAARTWMIRIVPEGSRDLGVLAFLRHELRDPAGRPHELRAAPG